MSEIQEVIGSPAVSPQIRSCGMPGPKVFRGDLIQIGVQMEQLLPAGEMRLELENELVQSVGPLAHLDTHGISESVVLSVVLVANFDEVSTSLGRPHSWLDLDVANELLCRRFREWCSYKVEVAQSS